MKKIVVLLLVLMIILSVCSCAAPPSESAQVQLEDVLSTLADGLAELQKQENADATDVSVDTPANTVPQIEFEEEKTAVCGITLKELKRITPQKELLFSKGDLTGASGDFICTVDDAENFTVCDSWGNELENGLIISAYEPYEGYVITLQEGTLVDQTQLMTADGEVIIPYIEANIEFLNDRYLEIIVPEEVTDNAAEAVLRETDSILSFTVQEGDILYKGYKRVFDLQTGKYVPNLELRTNDSDVAACGDTLYVKDDHEYNMILDSNGEIVAEGFKTCDVEGMFYIISYNWNDKTVYDCNMNALFDCGGHVLSGLEGSKYYLKYYRDGMDGIMDASGNVLIDAKYDYIREYHNELFVVNVETANGESLYGLCDLDGNEIVPCEYEYMNYEHGYYLCKKEGTYFLLASDGKQIAALGEYAESAFACREEKGLFYVLVLNTGEYSMEFERKPKTLHYEEQKLFVAYDKITDKYALFECVNGTQLTEYKYDGFKYHAGKVYARSGENYTIYEIQYQYR